MTPARYAASLSQILGRMGVSNVSDGSVPPSEAGLIIIANAALNQCNEGRPGATKTPLNFLQAGRTAGPEQRRGRGLTRREILRRPQKMSRRKSRTMKTERQT